MPSANETLLDEFLIHQLYLERFRQGRLDDLQKFLLALMDDVSALLGQRLSDVSKANTVNTRRLQQMLVDIERVSDQTAEQIQSTVTQQLRDLTVYESGWTISAMKAVIPVTIDFITVAPTQLWAAVNERPFEGRLMTQWFKDYSAIQKARITEAVRMGVVEGQTIDQIVRRVRGTQSAGYSDGIIMGVTKRSAEALTRTAVSHVVTMARQATFEDNVSVIKGLTWRSTLDGRTSEICQARDGQFYNVDTGPRPPAHPNCFVAGTLVTLAPPIEGATERLYDGEMITISTASGNELTVTPNHPVLTRRGWKPAGLIDHSDHLVRHKVCENMTLRTQLPHDDMPATIKQVVEALGKSGKMTSSVMPVTAKDFHGDASNGQIAIVWTDSSLSGDNESTLLESLEDLVFQIRDAVQMGLTSLSTAAKSFIRINVTAPGFVGSACQFASNFRAGSLHSSNHLFRFGAQPTAFLDDDFLDKSARKLGLLDDPCRTHPLIKEFDHVTNVTRCWVNRTHVYNLQTVGSYYGANGYIVHNCRSTMVPVLKSWKELGINLKEAPEGTRATMDGQVPVSETYQTWLKRQPVSFQDDVLGVTKGKLFRKGDLTLQKFVDEGAGRAYTIDELRAKHPEAFKRAGA